MVGVAWYGSHAGVGLVVGLGIAEAVPSNDAGAVGAEGFGEGVAAVAVQADSATKATAAKTKKRCLVRDPEPLATDNPTPTVASLD